MSTKKMILIATVTRKLMTMRIENEVGLEGGVGGESSVLVDPNLQISTDSQSSGEVITGLLDEMLRKVDGIAGQLLLTPFSS